MYYLYIIQCADKSLYTGITTDLKRRVEEHNNSVKGAKYTASRRPVKMVYSREYKNRSLASKQESLMKKLTRKEKLELIASDSTKIKTAKQFQDEIRKLANPAKAKLLAGFFKTGKGQYGEGDVFLGVMAPQLRFLVAKHGQMPLEQVLSLLQSKFHEERLASLLIMVAQFKEGDEEKRKQIFFAYLKNTKSINNWDLVDLSAHHIVGAYLSDKPKEILYELAQSKLLWNRRIAMVATFYEIRLGRCELALSIAEKLLSDKEDLMHKAVGWMLREVGKRCSQQKEEKFLQKHGHAMSRTTLRYAIERFEEEKRQQYLKRKL